MSPSILFRHTATECFFLSYSLFVGLQSCSLHLLSLCTTCRSYRSNWTLANNQVRSGIPKLHSVAVLLNILYFYYSAPFFCKSSRLLKSFATLPSTNSTSRGIFQLCNTVKWYELLTSQLTIQSYSAFSLLSNTPPSVSRSMLFVGIFDGANWDKDNVFKISETRRERMISRKIPYWMYKWKKVVCLFPVWKVFIQLIFSLQGESKIGMHFSGKLLKPECPVNPSSSSRLTASMSLSVLGKLGIQKSWGEGWDWELLFTFFPANGKIKWN